MLPQLLLVVALACASVVCACASGCPPTLDTGALRYLSFCVLLKMSCFVACILAGLHGPKHSHQGLFHQCALHV